MVIWCCVVFDDDDAGGGDSGGGGDDDDNNNNDDDDCNGGQFAGSHYQLYLKTHDCDQVRASNIHWHLSAGAMLVLLTLTFLQPHAPQGSRRRCELR